MCTSIDLVSHSQFVSIIYQNDELFLRLKWYFWCGKSLHLENPTTFNEKLQWLKLYDHQMQYSQMVDKITAKEFVASIIGERYIIPTLEVWNTVEDINFHSCQIVLC